MGKCSKDKRDIHYRSAKQEGYRARSAFKLLNLNSSNNGRIFNGVKRAVDLCAAPGSWSQVLSNKIYMPHRENPLTKLVAVDFLEMVPIPGVIQLQGDITEVATAERILAQFDGEKADLVVCDGAPDVTGFHDLDIHRHQDIVIAGLAITTAVLKEGGTMVMKVFKKESDNFLPQQVSTFFRDVLFLKPEGSRDSSLEMFAVCFDHYCPSGYSPRMLLEYFACKDIKPFLKTRIPFVLYGELDDHQVCDSQRESLVQTTFAAENLVADCNKPQMTGSDQDTETSGKRSMITGTLDYTKSVGTPSAERMDKQLNNSKFNFKNSLPLMNSYLLSVRAERSRKTGTSTCS